MSRRPVAGILAVGLVVNAAACGPAGGSAAPATPQSSTAPRTPLPTLAAPHASPMDPSVDGSNPPSAAARAVREFDVRPGTHPHDVYPAADGGVWFSGQRVGTLGYLDPATGAIDEIPLGSGSAPHGVVVGPDGAP